MTISAPQHPIVAGLKPFQADDELYTCLTGDRPIEVLAEARSKVDGKIYPMAFAYASGKGRVFQCLLGHDVKAMQMPGVGELYRRGCALGGGNEALEPDRVGPDVRCVGAEISDVPFVVLQIVRAVHGPFRRRRY